MTESKYTPGPWKTKRNDSANFETSLGYHSFRIVLAAHDDIAYCPATDDDNGNANARLIAAAPDMLEALEAMNDHFTKWFSDPSYVAPEDICDELSSKVVNAIKKAKGENDA